MPAVAYRYSSFEAARAGFDFLVACDELFRAMIRHRPYRSFLAEVSRLKRIAKESGERLDDSPGHDPQGLDAPAIGIAKGTGGGADAAR